VTPGRQAAFHEVNAITIQVAEGDNINEGDVAVVLAA
jgi:hypothetical protein